MTRELQVLIVEDSAADADLLLRELVKGGYVPVHERVETAAAMPPGRVSRQSQQPDSHRRKVTARARRLLLRSPTWRWRWASQPVWAQAEPPLASKRHWAQAGCRREGVGAWSTW